MATERLEHMVASSYNSCFYLFHTETHLAMTKYHGLSKLTSICFNGNVQCAILYYNIKELTNTEELTNTLSMTMYNLI